MFAVVQSSGELIGRSGLHYWPQFDETEVGWVLRRDRWGQGLATEAGAASLQWGFSTARLRMITAIVANENGPSRAVASKLGMKPLRPDHIFDRAVTVFAAYASDR